MRGNVNQLKIHLKNKSRFIKNTNEINKMHANQVVSNLVIYKNMKKKYNLYLKKIRFVLFLLITFRIGK